VAAYSFETTWVVAAPIERVWETMADAERWPEWWPGLDDVEVVERGDANRVGELLRFRWRTPLRYPLVVDMRTTRVERPQLCEASAHGALEGDAHWRLREEGDATEVTYEMSVATTSPWMNLLAPLARPLFTRSHDAVMRAGGEGLAKRLG
jgi:uncharacterized protein YndB with AHSA1/START domain